MRWIHHLAAFAPFLIVTALVAALASPPPALPASAPADVFSAGRAMEDVRGLTSTGKPHPAAHYDGSERSADEIADHTRARDWVMQRLRDLGLSPSLHRGRVCARACSEPENIVARIDGVEPGPALMLAAHYDSTPFGPGASDDGAGVATVLETVRALRAGPQIRRSLILLIDDGEEMGLLGAKLFVKEHPFARDVGVVLNFEARGSSGQTAMFETSAENGGLIAAFAGAVERPAASSVIYALYKRLPNDTDLTIFKQAGLQGLNFAFADGVRDYHTASDTAASLDPRSLQHMGDQSLAMSRALLSAGSLPAPAPDAVYFDLFTLYLVRYPAAASGPLSVVAALAAIYVLAAALRRRRTTIGRVAMAAAVTLGSLVAGSAAGLVLGTLFKLIRFPGSGSGPLTLWVMLHDKHPVAPWLALVSLGAAVSLAFALWLGPRARSLTTGLRAVSSPGAQRAPAAAKSAPEGDAAAAARPLDAIALSGGALLLWTLLGLLAGWGAPGAGYLFVWPLFGLAAGLAILEARAAPSPWRRAAAAAVAAAPAALLWIPIVRVLLIMVGATLPPAAILPVAFIGTAAAPLLAASPPRLKWALPALAAALALGAAIVACFLPG